MPHDAAQVIVSHRDQTYACVRPGVDLKCTWKTIKGVMRIPAPMVATMSVRRVRESFMKPCHILLPRFTLTSTSFALRTSSSPSQSKLSDSDSVSIESVSYSSS